MIDSVQKPSPTITLYNQLAAATMAQNRSSNTRSVKYNRKNAAHTQKQLVDTQQLQTTMDSLESQIQTVKQQSNVVPKEARQQQFSLNDILPVSLNKAEAAQENQSENATNDNIMDANIPMQEKIKILRQHPDLLRKFVLESQQIQRQEAINTYNNHLVQRKQHRNLICRGLPQIKFIDNFVTHNLAQNISDAMRKSRLQAKRQYQGMLTDAQIDNVLSRKRNLLEREEFDAQNNVSQPKISTILPMIFINQRNTLGVYLFFSSRIAVLRQVGAVYDKIKRSNNLILWAKGIILRGLSNRHQFNREQAELRAAFLITRNLRIYVNRRNKNNRISSLRTAKALLLENYNQQCFLGAVVRFTSSKELIVQSVHDLNTKNNARVHVLMSYLLGYQKNSAFQIWKTEKDHFIARQMRVLQADSRKIKEFKQFIALYPPDKPVLPTMEQDQARIAELELPVETQLEMSWQYVLRVSKAMQEDLQQNYLLNSQPGAINVNTINLIPTDAYLEQMLWVVRRKQNLQDWLDGQEVVLLQPEEEYK